MKLVVALFILGIAAIALAIYLYMSTKEAFLDLGTSCDPEVENTCGKEAICQTDDAGKNGICFPKPDEEKEEVK